MRKLMLTLVLGVVAAFGLGGTGVAQAASCNAAYPFTPSVAHHPPVTIQAVTSFYCDTAYYVQFYDTLFAGDVPGWGQQGPVINSVAQPAYGTLYGTTKYPCPLGGAHWWGHWTDWRIKWVGNSVYGPWHETVQSGGVYDVCTS